MGMITPSDIVLALSNSGETDEIITLLPIIKRLAIPLVTLTGNPDSTLARSAHINLDVSVAHEACPLNLAPTSSTTAALAMGDALAVSLLHIRGFTREEFAHSHPSGKLGRRLLLRVSDIMHTDTKIPRVFPNATLSDALIEMSQKGLGLTAITDSDNRLLGIFTDGDLRRTLDHNPDLKTTLISDVMTTDCRTCTPDTMATEVLHTMETTRINAILVVDTNHTLVGALNMHDLLKARII
jgi:arabinose-5-phosphate isomerase